MSKAAVTSRGYQATFADTVINPDCVHLFEYNKDKMIFDIASGMVLEVTDFVYEAIDLCRKKDWPGVTSELQKRYPGVSSEELVSALDQLRAKGLFKSPPEFGQKQQEKRIDILWRHHPYRLQLVISQSCNLSCLYCYMENNESNARKLLMRKKQALQAVDHLIERSGRRRNLQIMLCRKAL